MTKKIYLSDELLRLKNVSYVNTQDFGYTIYFKSEEDAMNSLIAVENLAYKFVPFFLLNREKKTIEIGIPSQIRDEKFFGIKANIL
jgi:hypothetical protein